MGSERRRSPECAATGEMRRSRSFTGTGRLRPSGRLRSSTQRIYTRTRRRRRVPEGLRYSQRQMPAGQPASGMCAQVAASHRTRPPANACIVNAPSRALPEQRAAGVARPDAVPPWRHTSLVPLQRIRRRPPLRTARGEAVPARPRLRVPPVLWISLCEPTGDPAPSRHQPSAKAKDAPWWERQSPQTIS